MSIIALDYETNSLEWWSPTFKVKSMALAWRSESTQELKSAIYYEDEIAGALEELKGHQILVYNAGFDIAICQHCYGVKLEWVDVQRLRQLRSRVDKHKGENYSLKQAVKLFIPGRANYEDEIKDWAKENHPKEKWGSVIHLAPVEILEAYNKADAETTLQLYEQFVDHFREVDPLDWEDDHTYYRALAETTINAVIRGIKVDQSLLQEYIQDCEQEVAKIDERFEKQFETELLTVRERLKTLQQSKYKKKIVTELPPFNISSKKHLEYLFIDILGLKPQFYTPTRRPSFKSSHIGSYGPGGKILERRGKRLVVKGQAEALLEKVQGDFEGRYRPQLKIIGTKSGRCAGAGGVNVQGLARSETKLMASFKADPAKVWCERDVVGAEAAVVSYYSRDPGYIFANLVGKKSLPYEKDGVLWVGDPYLMFGSVSGLGSDELWADFRTGRYGTRTFSEQWLVDPEEIKERHKKYRKINKMLVLALSYGLHSKKMSKQLKDQFGLDFPQHICEKIYSSYWSLFPLVAKAKKREEDYFNRHDYITTEFGFRCHGKGVISAFNSKIQSSISSIMVIETALTLEKAPWAEWVTVIHDSSLYQIPEDKVDLFKQVKMEVENDLNSMLGWSVKILFSEHYGKDWSELK